MKDAQAVNRRTVKIKATEMHDADVQIISLVGRGANRIPFRIKKSETGMIDLASLFRISKAEKTPTVVAVMTKGEHAEALAEKAKEFGFEVVSTQVHKDEEGISVLSFTEKTEYEDAVVLKMAEDVAVVVANVQKGFTSWGEDNDFVTNVTQAGFFPGLRLATDVLHETIANNMYNAQKGEAPVAEVQKTLQDFSSYVEGLLSMVPAKAFKFEDVVLKGILISDVEGHQSNPTQESREAAAAANKEVTAPPYEETNAPEQDARTAQDLETRGEAAAEGEEQVQKEGDMGYCKKCGTKLTKKNMGGEYLCKAHASKEDNEGAGEGEPEPVKKESEGEGGEGKATKSEDQGLAVKMDEILGAIGKVTTNVGALTQKLQQVEETTTGLATKLDEVEKVAQKAEEAVNGTVHSEEADDVLTTTQKGDNWGGDGLFDTAYQKVR